MPDKILNMATKPARLPGEHATGGLDNPRLRSGTCAGSRDIGELLCIAPLAVISHRKDVFIGY